MRRRVLLVAPDRVGPQMAAPGIRYAELARSLAASHDVKLAAPIGSGPLPGVPVPVSYDPRRPGSLARHLDDCDVVAAPPLPPSLAEQITRSAAHWIADLYNPEPFEGLLAHANAGIRRRRALDVLRIDRISYAARTADAFVCAGERQRDMWLGYLAASRRIGSALHDRDPQLHSLISVVGCGVPERPPTPPAEPVLRGNALPADARIVIWNGGLWPWLDFGAVVRAIARLRKSDARWALVVAGSGRPGHRTARDSALRDAHAQLGPSGLHVAGAWTDYARRADFLLEADVGVCAHTPGTESRYAERLRLLDLMWAGVPIVCSEGDPLAELVAERGLGQVAPQGDATALADALSRTAAAGRGAYAGALAASAAERRWSSVAAPLAAQISVAAGGRRRVGPVARALALRHRAAARLQRVSGA